MQKILGLDIGSYSVKAVEILNTYRNYKVTHFHEIVVPEIEGVDPADIGMTTVRQIFRQNDIRADKVYTGIMGILASARIFDLHNVKRRNMGLVVQSELESQAPFRIEDVVVDHQVLDMHGTTSTVLAVMARKDDVEAYLSELQKLNIEPKIIDVDYLAFMNLVPFFQFEEDEPEYAHQGIHEKSLATPRRRRYRLLVDVGHQKTSVLLFKGDTLVAARTIRMAGRYVTEFLEKNLGVTYAEAQRIKHAVSRIETAEDARAEPGHEREFLVARLMGVAVSELVREIVRTVHSFAAQEKVRPEAVYISGGTSIIAGFREYLEGMLATPVKSYSFQSDKIIIDEDLSHKTSQLIQALALGLRGVHSKKQSQINLRRGELALVGSYDKLIYQITNVSIIVASLVVCLLASYLLRAMSFGGEIARLKTEYREAVKKTLKQEPQELSRVASKKNYAFSDYSSKAVKALDAGTREANAAVDYFMERQSVFPLRVLEDVSKMIPKQISTEGPDGPKNQNLVVDVLEFSVQGKTINIEGETDSRASAETIGTLLKNSSTLQNVNLTATAKTGSDKIIKFRVQAGVKEAL
jgi:type IV pilus assembly protein PilM